MKISRLKWKMFFFYLLLQVGYFVRQMQGFRVCINSSITKFDDNYFINKLITITGFSCKGSMHVPVHCQVAVTKGWKL